MTTVSPGVSFSMIGTLTNTSWPPSCPWTSPSARLCWSTATTLDRVSTTNRTSAVSDPTLTTLPASAPAPLADPTTGMPTLMPASVPASMPTSQDRLDGSRAMIRTGSSRRLSDLVSPNSWRSSTFSDAASVSSATRC